MKIRIVADTNVLVSHFLLPHQNPSKILNLAQEGRLTLMTSEFILQELERVLHAKIGFSREEALSARRSIQAVSETVRPHHAVDAVKADESDNRILECAVSGKAHFIVTGDKKHLLPLGEFKGIALVSPLEFLKIFMG